MPISPSSSRLMLTLRLTPATSTFASAVWSEANSTMRPGIAKHICGPLPFSPRDHAQANAYERLDAEHEQVHRLQAEIANVDLDVAGDPYVLVRARWQQLAFVAARQSRERDLAGGVIASG